MVVDRCGLFDSSSTDEDIALRSLNKADRNGVNGDGVVLHVENGEAKIDEVVASLVMRTVRHWHDFQRIANRYGVGALAIFILLDGKDRSGRHWWEDLASVGQHAAIFNEEIQDL